MKKIKTGREIFDKYHIFIKVVITFIKVFPKKIRKTFLNLISYRKSKVFVLLRYCIFYSLVKSCGKNVYIGANVEFKGLENIEVGDNVSIHKDSYIDASGNLKIGNDVSIAHNTSIISVNHTWEDESLPIKYNNMKPEKIEISEDVWIGAKTVILAGVHIGKRVVVAAGSVVTKNVENNVLVAGVPAKVIKKI